MIAGWGTADECALTTDDVAVAGTPVVPEGQSVLRAIVSAKMGGDWGDAALTPGQQEAILRVLPAEGHR